MTIEPVGRIAALVAAASRRSAESWQIGSILSGRLLGQNERGRLLLEIDGVTVESGPLADGRLPTAFQVRVASMGDPPVLEVILEPPAPTALPRAVTDALLSLLPQQLGQAALLGDLVALARNPALRVLPADLRAALVSIDSAVATPADLTRPEGLRLALAQSGLFHEARMARLAQSGGAPEDAALEDWKTALARLASALARVAPPGQHAPSPAATAAPPPLASRPLAPQPRGTTELIGLPELLGRMQTHVRGALVRLEIAQLQAHREAPNPIWTFELPAHGNGGSDLWQLRIQREGAGQSPDGAPIPPTWNVAFAVDLPSLGPIHGEVRLALPRVNVKLWAEQAAARLRLESTLPALAHRLRADGLVPGTLICQQGAPDRPVVASGARLLSATA